MQVKLYPMLRGNLTLKKLLLIITVLLLILAILPLSLNVSRTPELLHDAPAILGKYGDLTLGILWNDHAGFFLYGRGGERVQCRLVHAWGGEVENYSADGTDIDPEDPIPCLMVWREGKFRGWIEFRGHERAFCGASSTEKLPDLCMWR